VQGFPFIMALAGLASPLIHFTSIIYLRLYAYQRHITLIIRRFSWVVLSRTRQLYKDLELVQSISRRLIYRILSTIDLITTPMLKPWAIP